MIDTLILAVPVAMALHLAVCFVAKYGLWMNQGKTFHPVDDSEVLKSMPSRKRRQLAIALNRVRPGSIRRDDYLKAERCLAALTEQWSALVEAGLVSCTVDRC